MATSHDQYASRSVATAAPPSGGTQRTESGEAVLDTESTRIALQNLSRTHERATGTATELQRQEETIDHIGQQLEEMNNMLDHGDRLLDGITTFGAIKNTVTIQKMHGKNKKYNPYAEDTDEPDPYLAKPPLEEEKSSSTAAPSGKPPPINRAAKPVYGLSAHASERQKAAFEQQEEDLARIAYLLDDVHGVSADIGASVRKTSSLLDEQDDNLNSAAERLKKTNARMHKYNG